MVVIRNGIKIRGSKFWFTFLKEGVISRGDGLFRLGGLILGGWY